MMMSTKATKTGMGGISVVGNLPSQRYDYEPPSWATTKLKNPPQHGRLHLANLPTPIHKLPTNNKNGMLSLFEDNNIYNINLYIKRDDMTGGVETGGNKIRKLEFLLADAIANNYQSVVTIGGEQSNHCRATASAARMVGITPNLILRTKRADKIHEHNIMQQDQQQQPNKDGDGGKESSTTTTTKSGGGGIGITGNILYDRMVGSTIFTCTPGEYGRIGSKQLVDRVCSYIKTKTGNDPYPIPVGGSNGIGTWGYIEGVKELLDQWNEMNNTMKSSNVSDENVESLDHIVFACGSGGTAAGIALGIALAYEEKQQQEVVAAPPPQIHAIGVCDNPDYFYKHCAEIAIEMGFTNNDNNKSGSDESENTTNQNVEQYLRQHMKVYHGKGRGYAVNTPEELDFISKFALQTGIVLDPVYSGKALYNFVTKELLDDNKKHIYEGKNILFWHTGGALGLFDKEDSIISTLSEVSKTHRLDIYGKGPEFGGIDISNPVDG